MEPVFFQNAARACRTVCKLRKGKNLGEKTVPSFTFPVNRFRIPNYQTQDQILGLYFGFFLSSLFASSSPEVL